jgi:hypothetical protein
MLIFKQSLRVWGTGSREGDNTPCTKKGGISKETLISKKTLKVSKTFRVWKVGA